MPLHLLDYSRIPLWSATDLAYIGQDPKLRPFYAHPPTREGLAQALDVRRAHATDRDLLYAVIEDQYQMAGIPLPEHATKLRSPKTFTVTTAHQPSLLTGPLYNIYKIASTIRLAAQLSATHADTDVLPVFVVGGEDHDWAEINHLHLFGKRYTWEREASGACGRLSVDGLETFIDEIFAMLERNPFTPSAHALFRQCLDGVTTYGAFHQKLIASLFGRFGLIVLNMDDARLKRAFIPWMERELTASVSLRTVPPVQQELERAGFKAQAYCRPVNLFHMGPGSRERIDNDGDGFVFVESGTRHSRQAMIDLLHARPEDFSPNVVLRPLYQEHILPNIAFVGGGGEIAYWLERKAQFADAQIPYPVLIRRNSLMLLDEAAQQQLAKAGLTWSDILDDYDTVVKRYLLTHSEADLTFDAELAALGGAFTALAAKAERVDPTLAKAIAAEQTKQTKAFEQLGSRLLRAEKHQQEAQLHRIQKVRERLFPNNGLQERHENFLSFYTQYGPEWIEKLIPLCDPLDNRFRLLELPL
jgi:bacillithiol biosynthesis cysteine-adding enzyme BshC